MNFMVSTHKYLVIVLERESNNYNLYKMYSFN